MSSVEGTYKTNQDKNINFDVEPTKNVESVMMRPKSSYMNLL